MMSTKTSKNGSEDVSASFAINPFAGRPSHKEGYSPPSLREGVGKENIIERDLEVIKYAIRDESSYFSITTGAYGSGKTALQELRRHIFQNQAFSGIRIVIAFIVQPPPEPRRLVPLIIGSILDSKSITKKLSDAWTSHYEMMIPGYEDSDDAQFINVFNEFCNWLRTEYRYIPYIVMDELEEGITETRVTLLTPEERSSLHEKLQGFRRFFDSLTCVVAGDLLVTPEAFSVIIDLHNALPDRFPPRYSREIQFLSFENAKKMVELDKPEDIEFTDEAIRYAWIWSKDGLVRWFQEALHGVLDEAYSKDVTTITKDFIIGYLEKIRKPSDFQVMPSTPQTPWESLRPLLTEPQADRAYRSLETLSNRIEAVRGGLFQFVINGGISSSRNTRVVSSEKSSSGEKIELKYTPREMSNDVREGTAWLYVRIRLDEQLLVSIEADIKKTNVNIESILIFTLSDIDDIEEKLEKIGTYKEIPLSVIIKIIHLDDDLVKGFTCLNFLEGRYKEGSIHMQRFIDINEKISEIANDLKSRIKIIPTLQESYYFQTYRYMILRESRNPFNVNEATERALAEINEIEPAVRRIKDSDLLELVIGRDKQLSTSKMARNRISDSIDWLTDWGFLEKIDDQYKVKISPYELDIFQKLIESDRPLTVDNIYRDYFFQGTGRKIVAPRQMLDFLTDRRLVEINEESMPNRYYPAKAVGLNNKLELFRESLTRLRDSYGHTFVARNTSLALSALDSISDVTDDDSIETKYDSGVVINYVEGIITRTVVEITKAKNIETQLISRKIEFNDIVQVVDTERYEIDLEEIANLFTKVNDAINENRPIAALQGLTSISNKIRVLRKTYEVDIETLHEANQRIKIAREYLTILEEIASYYDDYLNSIMNYEDEVGKLKEDLKYVEDLLTQKRYNDVIIKLSYLRGIEQPVSIVYTRLSDEINRIREKLGNIRAMVAGGSAIATIQTSKQILNSSNSQLQKITSNFEVIRLENKFGDILAIIEDLKLIDKNLNQALYHANQSVKDRLITEQVDTLSKAKINLNAGKDVVLDWIDSLLEEGGVEDIIVIWSDERYRKLRDIVNQGDLDKLLTAWEQFNEGE